MPNYRRLWVPGGTYFFTVNLSRRRHTDLLVRHVGRLRDAVRRVLASHPFEIHGWVVLPDHLHCVMQLPADDPDFATRWRLIKSHFTRSLPTGHRPPGVSCRTGERGIWQRRYWEHLIRDETDYRAHLDYLHINPVRHGLVPSVADWPYSSFHRWVERGAYPRTWAGSPQVDGVECPD